MSNKLFCTFIKIQDLYEVIDGIKTEGNLLYDKIFVLSIKGKQDLAITYTPKYLQINEGNNTILVHRKKLSNTLYTINALNEIIKQCNNGIVDKQYQVNWDNYQNSILLTRDEQLNKYNTKIFKVISL